jgi:DNA-binding CsgD family transcriptional regulator
VARFDEVPRFVSESGFRDPITLSFVPDHVEALVAKGDLDAAEGATAAFESHAEQLGIKIALARAARCRGQLVSARGDPAAGVEILARARADAERLGHPFELARIVLAEGTALRRAKRIAEAREALNDAASMFETLGAALWAQRARAELARLGGRPARSRELTPTEQQIADLVATGRSNYEVAQTLHVSPKTVEWNLSKIYKKLRVSSRTELAAKLAKAQS